MKQGQILVVSCTGKKAIVNKPVEAKQLLAEYGRWAFAWASDEKGHTDMVGFCNEKEQVVWKN